ncbi:histidinol dehydrogenase [Virgibacillus pantothenticus]|uniref:histidinol dehydrogenase n=1 Tax=Virgibacillus TaxID=84406 RepID=UPI00090A67DF|nr:MULTISPECIES: histidinol dehydrogenase [Virgibacillus]API92907.1 histidinol dehydrogenase [Virgibacillus sp. 6R]MBS7428424.1 histidinol dehydrogenase [Virgibacillus sp. 19R1-5]GIP63022.1 histidinol dehydrogenase [Virgibacillus pantothenticus]
MERLTAMQYWDKKQKRAQRTQQKEKALDQTVLEIIQCVRNEGDQAIRSFTEKFDGVSIEAFMVTEEEFNEARKSVSPSFIKAVKTAAENITQFHEKQLEQSWLDMSKAGTMVGQKVTPLDRVAIYVPGGKAAYPSTVLMNVIPAKIAGVNHIYLTTPPQADGKINPYVLVAAKEVGVETIYKIGGAQSIAAFAYGTETIPKVQKITGPGNAYVASAKKWVYGDVAIDMIAGPSEICIVADETANVNFIAADLLSQAEHDEEAQAICITTSIKQAEAVELAVQEQTKRLARKVIIQKSLDQHGQIIVADTMDDAFAIVNDIAPEHLQLMIAEPIEKLGAVKHAGAIFLGNYSPEALGDYVAGPNHTLPTNGTAAFASPLGVYDFMKKSSVIYYDKRSLLAAADTIIELANTEQLTAHAQSVQIRKEE